MRREAKAHALIDALVACERDDRVPFLEALLQALYAGAPLPVFGRLMDDARSWARAAARHELKAYCAAAFAALSPEDQHAFRVFIGAGRSAA